MNLKKYTEEQEEVLKQQKSGTGEKRISSSQRWGNRCRVRELLSACVRKVGVDNSKKGGLRRPLMMVSCVTRTIRWRKDWNCFICQREEIGTWTVKIFVQHLEELLENLNFVRRWSSLLHEVVSCFSLKVFKEKHDGALTTMF